MEYERFQSLKQELQTKYEEILTMETPFEVSQSGEVFYQFGKWKLSVKIQIAERKKFFITIDKERIEEKFNVYIGVTERYNNGTEILLEQGYLLKEKEKFSIYYVTFKQVLLKWIQSVPSLRLVYVLSPEKVLKEMEPITELMGI